MYLLEEPSIHQLFYLIWGELHEILKLQLGDGKGALQCAAHVASRLQEMSITPQEVSPQYDQHGTAMVTAISGLDKDV